MIFLYGPVLMIPLFSFNDSLFATFPLKGFTLKHYGTMAANTGMLAALQNSILVAVCSSLIATAIGLMAAIALTRNKLPGNSIILAAFSLPLIVPSIVFGVAILIIMLKFLGIPLSLWTVGAAHVFICIPFSRQARLTIGIMFINY